MRNEDNQTQHAAVQRKKERYVMISRWYPFSDLSVLRDRINRIFNEQVGRGETESASSRV